MTLASSSGTQTTPVAIVGAGPYGLSIAAHLRARGIAFRIFGVAMETWRTHMPRGMFLKSEGFASRLYDADGSFSLAGFCRERRVPYADVGVPVALQTFSDYGLAFQRRYAPDLDTRKVARLERTAYGFSLTLEDGETVRARRAIVAVGISHYDWMPDALAGAPPAFVTHTSAHHDLERFRGRRVTVIGSGASAVDTAALLHEAGAQTRLVARTRELIFHDPPKIERSLYERVRYPRSGLGPNVKSFLYSEFPDAFALLPPSRRVAIVRQALGPAACWFSKAQIVGKVETLLGLSLQSADVCDGRVHLHVRDGAGRARDLESDHVIAGTGYRVDLSRLAFVPDGVRTQIRTLDGSPVLNRNFESSVPGLHFVGISAAVTFGPLLRFAFGARFAAQRLTSHLERALAPERAGGRVPEPAPEAPATVPARVDDELVSVAE